jgi:hypothetical protein
MDSFADFATGFAATIAEDRQERFEATSDSTAHAAMRADSRHP